MTTEIISVGTELLLGDIVNTNAQYLAKRLAAFGMAMHFQTVVGDNPAYICQALDTAYSRAELVIMTGGLGPTKDDMTKEMLMRYFGKKPYLDERALQNVIQVGTAFGLSEITEAHRKQAILPDDSIILYNQHGSAPGCIMEQNGKICILLPGPPKEMKPMFESEACLDFLKRHSTQAFVSMYIKTYGREERPGDRIGESVIAKKLDDLLNSPNPTVATYLKEDGCLIRITAAAQNREQALKQIAPILAECRKRIGEDVIQTVTEQAD